MCCVCKKGFVDAPFILMGRLKIAFYAHDLVMFKYWLPLQRKWRYFNDAFIAVSWSYWFISASSAERQEAGETKTLTLTLMSFPTLPVCSGSAELGEKLPTRAPSVDERSSRMRGRPASVAIMPTAHSRRRHAPAAAIREGPRYLLKGRNVVALRALLPDHRPVCFSLPH